MSRPEPAPLRPRVVSPHTGETLLAEDWIEPFLRRSEAGALCLYGAPGSGKTTALAHLASRFSRPAVLVLLDEPDAAEVEELRDHVTVVYTAREPHRIDHLATAALASWGEDERLEYLMARHRDRCSSVMGRVRSALERETPPENAELWRIVLDRAAGDEAVASVSQALRQHLDREFGWWQRRLARRYGLSLMTSAILDQALERMSVPGCLGLFTRPLEGEPKRLLRYRSVQLLLAGEGLARELRGRRRPGFLETPLPPDLIRETGTHLAKDPRALRRLREWLSGEPTDAMVASLLHASGCGWTPEEKGTVHLKRGRFPEARWVAFRLPNMNLAEADLRRASLIEVSSKGLNLSGACLRGACLRGTSASALKAEKADLTEADLSHLRGPDADFSRADLTGATLEMAFLRGSRFAESTLVKARFCRADLRNATLVGSDLEDADFSGANLESANLFGLDLRKAVWDGARFVEADLRQCILEGMELPGGIFEKAYLNRAILTGSRMPSGRFFQARLGDARLGDVEWEQADLRDADLRGATFRMGSSRSGLVFAAPLEGSRTGFYTHDDRDQSYRAPEEIRKANLRGADLRGARLDGADFYLVDLRDARYTPDQEAHFRRCGAILSVNV